MRLSADELIVPLARPQSTDASGRLTVFDNGYYKGEEIVACEQAGIAVAVSKPLTSNAAAVGRFDRADFVYHAEKDTYECPAGKWLPYHYTNEQDGKTVWNYWTIDCVACVI